MENYKNQLIIFSKNRACQLNLLLDSIKNNAPALFDKIHVLYKAEGDYFLGYEKIKEKYTGVNFYLENNFRYKLHSIPTINWGRSSGLEAAVRVA